MNADAKQRLKDTLLANARAERDALAEDVAVDDEATHLDQDTSFSVDDQSQADEAGDLSGLLQRSHSKQDAAVAQIEALDVSPTDTVRAGAVVGFGGRRFIVGVVSDEFDVDGVAYQGISLDSPVFAAIEGKGKGETFTVGDHEHTVEFVA